MPNIGDILTSNPFAPQPSQVQKSPYGKPGNYVTQLAPAEEQMFQQWVNQNKIPWQNVPTADYDMRGYWKAMQSGDPRARQAGNKHFPDIWKTPYHKSFSRESIYALPNAPRWIGSSLIDENGSIVYTDTK